MARDASGCPLLYAWSWRDRSKVVNCLSTMDFPLGVTESKVKATATVAYHKKKVPQPGGIALYNRAMGGSDLVGQMAHGHRPRLRCKKPMQPLFLYFLTVAALNAKILYVANRRKAMSFSSFLMALIQQLTNATRRRSGMFGEKTPPGSPPRQKFKHCTPVTVADERRTTDLGKHRLWIAPRSQKGRRNPGRCVICRQTRQKQVFTNLKCDRCKVWLCTTGLELLNCWNKWHEEEHPLGRV